MNGAILLVTDVLFERTTVIVTTLASAALFVGLWFVLGLVAPPVQASATKRADEA